MGAKHDVNTVNTMLIYKFKLNFRVSSSKKGAGRVQNPKTFLGYTWGQVLAW